MKKPLRYFLYLVVSMWIHQVNADTYNANTYDDIAKATGGKVTHMSKEDINDPAIRKEILESLNSSTPAKEPLPNFSSNKSAWYLRKLKLKVQSTGTIGAHAGWAYNKFSIEKMAENLSPNDVPGLLELFSTEENPICIEMALGSQCQAGLDGVLNSVNDKTFHKFNATYVDTHAAKEIIERISNFDRCDAETRQHAQQALVILRQNK